MLITHNVLVQQLKSYKSPKAKITTMIKKGEIALLKRGFYSTSPSDDLLSISAFLFPNSYVSFETALSLYGLIPERVYETTCAGFDLKHNIVYSNERGRFSYQYIPKKVFSLGLTLEKNETGAFLLASPEKALCDELYKRRNIKTISQVEELLFENLRLEVSIRDLNWKEISLMIPKYHSTTLESLLRWRNYDSKHYIGKS